MVCIALRQAKYDGLTHSNANTLFERCLQHARMEIHYETNGGFLEEGQLLKPENIAKIQHIPCTPSKHHSHRFKWSILMTDINTGSIVQGRYDVVCPPKTAWDLHKALPDSKLYMIPDAGHSVKVGLHCVLEPQSVIESLADCYETRSLGYSAS